jgi:hypothetical protein
MALNCSPEPTTLAIWRSLPGCCLDLIGSTRSPRRLALLKRPPAICPRLRRRELRGPSLRSGAGLWPVQVGHRVVRGGRHGEIRGARSHADAVMPGAIMTRLQHHMPIKERVARCWVDSEGRAVDPSFKAAEQGPRRRYGQRPRPSGPVSVPSTSRTASLLTPGSGAGDPPSRPLSTVLSLPGISSVTGQEADEPATGA